MRIQSPMPNPGNNYNSLSLKDKLKEVAAEAQKLQGHLNEHVPGEVIVRMKSADAPAGDLNSDYGLELIEKYDLPPSMLDANDGDLVHFRLPASLTDEQALALLRKDTRVEYAETNDRLHAVEAKLPNDLDPKLWGMSQDAPAHIHAPEAWGRGTGKNQAAGGPLIAVIDTGVDADHPDLAANLWTNPGEIAGNGVDDDNNGVVDDVHGYNVIDGTGNPVDDVGHGTHCSGTIGAVGDNGQGVVGVNWNANLMAVKFLGPQGGTLSDAVKAIAYATKMGARVTSNSWGGGGYNQALKDVLASSPALHIFAAGNDANNNDSSPAYPASYDLPNLISVAASDKKDHLATFSNYGKTSVDLAAPGVDIYSTYPGGQYKTMSGTSMATPHVAGAAGLLLSMNPELTNDQVKDLLFSTVDKVPIFEKKMVTGGRLNVGRAAAKLAGEDIPDPPNPPDPPAHKGCFKIFN